MGGTLSVDSVERAGVVLAHITDAHVSPFGTPKATLKHRSVEIMKDLVQQLQMQSVDCALFGGDNIDNRGHGEADLETFVELVNPLERALCILGNHESDSRAGRLPKARIIERLAGRGLHPGTQQQSCFSEGVGNVRVIGIDTTLEGSGGGYVSPETMRFLADALNHAEEEHIVILGHHLLYRAWEPYTLSSWDSEYLVANRAELIALLASHDRVRAYLCGHHHASRIQRIASRGHSGGFYHILTASPVAYPHSGRLLRFAQDGIHVQSLIPEVPGLLDEGRQAVLTGRKARRYATLGSRRDFLGYVRGRSSDNDIVLPYDSAPVCEHLGVAVERRVAI